MDKKHCEYCGIPIEPKGIEKKRYSKTRYCSWGCYKADHVGIGHIYLTVQGYLAIKTGKGKSKYELLHRLILQYKLGRKLKDGEIAHHINGDKTDNRPENLGLFESNSRHSEYHDRLWNGQHPKDSPESIRKRVQTRMERSQCKQQRQTA